MIRLLQSDAGRLLILAAVYFATGRVGLALPYFGTHVTLIWLPTGIATAAVLLWGYRTGLATALGALLVNYSIGSSWTQAAVIAVGNTAAPLLTATWLMRSGFHRQFDRQADVLRLGLMGAGGMLVSATWGTLSLYFFEAIPLQILRGAWLNWWIGDTVGVLLGTPLLLSINRANLLRLARIKTEAGAWLAVALATTWIAFLRPGPADSLSLPATFLTLALLAWASLRFGILGATLSSLFFATGAVAGTAQARGGFGLGDEHASQFALWGYIAVAVLTGLVLHALLASRELVEGRLRDRERRLRGLFELSPLGIVLSDLNGRLIEFNEAFRAALGYTTEELKRMAYWDLVARTDRDADLEQLRRLTRTGHYGPFEREFRRKDGSSVPMRLIGIRVQASDGSSLAWSIVEDVSEQRRIEADLRIAASVFEAQVGMFVTNAEGTILRVNRTFVEESGYEASELIGANPRLFRSGRHDQGFYEEMWRSLRTTGGWRGEIWDRRKNGETYPKLMTISAVQSAGGEVTNYVATQFDITNRKEAEQQIRHLAFFDPLTELPNRRLFLDRLQQALQGASRNRQYGAVLLIDLDHFKTLNESAGHRQGDELLRLAARRLAALQRSGDTVARFSGDEFVVLLEDLSANMNEAGTQAEFMAEQILHELRTPYHLESREYAGTASIGITLFAPGELDTDELLKQADLAMYQAKASGRDTLRFFDPQMQQAVTAHVQMEGHLRGALRGGQFVAHFQPQVGERGEAVGAELLLRWQHPERGLLYPDSFIPLAEETGLILSVGEWVLESACAQLIRWSRIPELAALSLAVNVSGVQLRQSDFVAQVLGILRRSGADPGRLRLELTESILLADVEDTIAKMKALSLAGVRFALDDFGTGYSSLSYIKRLPLHCLKVDRSFVRDILEDPNDAAIARTVIALAQSLGLAVVAEGVETAQQRDFLARLGCHQFQGFFFSRPVPLAEFEAFVNRARVH